MSNRLARVIETLISLGIPRDSLPTSRLEVSPSYIPVDGQRVRAYRAKSLVRLRIWDLDRVGEVLSSALAAGATNVEYLECRSIQEREGRDTAFRLAVEEANGEARILVEAQGMDLTRLVIL